MCRWQTIIKIVRYGAGADGYGSGGGEGCARREECHRLGGVRQDAKRRIVGIKINEDKLRTFAALPRHIYRWKRLHNRRSALERINARVGRDFQLERHYM